MILDESRIANHTQKKDNSCIPMSIECVLKLLGIIEQNDFRFQLLGGDDDKCEKPTDWIDNLIVTGKEGKRVLFVRRFETDRLHDFSKDRLEQLFKTIDYELDNNRYVIICLRFDKKIPITCM